MIQKKIPFIEIIYSQAYLKQVAKSLIPVDKIKHALKKTQLTITKKFSNFELQTSLYLTETRTLS